MSQPSDPDALRSALLRAAHDPDGLEPFCQQNADAIRRHFAAWTTVPPAVRDRPDLADLYLNGLAAVASVFASRLGDTSLAQTFSSRWDEGLHQARHAMSEFRFPDAIARLTELADQIGRLRGPIGAAYLPVVLATLGECHFQVGQAERALEPSQRALELARKSADRDNLDAYLGNLYETHRYLGQAEAAATCVDELAALAEGAGKAEDSKRYRNQARIVRAGEPLLRVVLDVAGHRHELDEVLAGVTGSLRFLFERNRLSLRLSEALTQHGEREMGAGRFPEALARFEGAMKADPYNPQPVYDSALVNLYLERPADAVALYDRTEQLAPGWFHCRTDGWLARQLQSGRYPHEVFLTLKSAQGGLLEPVVKAQMVARALNQAPDLAPLHHLHGQLLVEAQQQSAAESAFRRGLACAEEPDIETRLLVDLASVVASDDERRELCRRARERNGNLVACATAAVVLAFG